MILINPQDNGNFVLYDKENGKNRALWCTRTDGGQKPHENYQGRGDLIDVVSHRILQGGGIGNGQMLRSGNGKYTLRMQIDGNLVVYAGSTLIWESGTGNKGCQPFQLKMQWDNNLCIYDGTGERTWAALSYEQVLINANRYAMIKPREKCRALIYDVS